jgi:hypothetical protein
MTEIRERKTEVIEFAGGNAESGSWNHSIADCRFLIAGRTSDTGKQGPWSRSKPSEG